MAPKIRHLRVKCRCIGQRLDTRFQLAHQCLKGWDSKSSQFGMFTNLVLIGLGVLPCGINDAIVLEQEGRHKSEVSGEPDEVLFSFFHLWFIRFIEMLGLMPWLWVIYLSITTELWYLNHMFTVSRTFFTYIKQIERLKYYVTQLRCIFTWNTK